MTPTTDLEPPPDLLDRHQRRREQSIPTVSVLCGPIGLGAYRWRAWAAAQGRAVVTLSTTNFDTILPAWLRSLATTRDIVADAATWLGRVTGQDSDELRRGAAALTAHEFEWFWGSQKIPAGLTKPAAFCRLLLAPPGDQATPPLSCDRLLQALCGERAPADVQALMHLVTLVPRPGLPALLLVPPDPSTAAWPSGAALALAKLATAVPALPAAVAAAAETSECLAWSGLPPHTLALLREGFVRIESLAEADLADRLRAAGVTTGPCPAASRLVKDGVSEDLAAAFADAARQVGKQATAEEENAARSAAERFLFERLESLPATVGLFALNQRLDFHHGPAPAEVDLCAASLRLAVELDGSYYHLRDPAAYRRDRRKDWELQRRGYLVLRFLSEDVVERLEDILDTILAAVDCRRPSHPKGGRPE
jgi:Protein of unknown function (DUF559)